MLTDFGLTVVAEITLSQTVSSNLARGGSVRWLAPELLSPDPEMSRKSIAADVYAFGRLLLAVSSPMFSPDPNALM